MNIKSHVKTGDTVLVLTGKDAGKKGKSIVTYFRRKEGLVEGVNIRRFTETSRNEPRRRKNRETGHIHISNVMLICQNCKQPTRIGRKYLDDGSKVRYCKEMQ